MQKTINITLTPEQASEEKIYKPLVAKELKIKKSEISLIRVINRSIDARSRNIKVNLRLFVVFDEPAPKEEEINFKYQNVKNKTEIIIIGAGPAGLFAALRLIELGYKPIIFERGKQVSDRKNDIALLYKEQEVNPDSNYCYGEGGAGTFSDGKLFTRSKKRGNTQKILEVLKFHGANENILIDSHPHIGTDKLPKIIENIRETIINAGGEIHFNSRVTDFIIDDAQIKGVEINNDLKITAKAVILATGHSARDIYELLHKKNIQLQAKPFAMGVRIEHPQNLIDSIQYHCKVRSEYLPAATYNVVRQVNNRGVYSFCMCPGGFIVPASTSPNEMVVNGMSSSARNSKFANSAMVVEIRLEDLKEYEQYGELAGLKFQQHVEKLAFNNGGNKLVAPAQRMADFVNKRISNSLPETSYIPGIISSPLHFWLPEVISKPLQEGFKQFGKSIRNFLTNEAVIIGVESRTSSPVRIPRDKETFQHPQIKGLFPCGEGAGYAGGIVSSAVDGEKCAEKIALAF
ncbi:MAG: NAD(P)/FAD-dependent oxidoreductase [Bacteroidales bacterium]|nr:NAD(P)/FAD-dependent oxidoreductase [Bacteroidales bacterium]